ncbi:MAG: FIST C-terminal domain-containing protein [Arcobacteraceae bacterium]|nr:FIST C-terminal domain-containing protein [Arcobacteraceae bacterium]
MKTYNYKYIDNDNLKDYIKSNFQEKDKNILIQIFCSIIDEIFIQNLLNIVNKQLPKAKIIGTTTAGEIVDGESIEDGVIFSFSVFDSTSIETSLIVHENKVDSSFEMGKRIVQNNIKTNTKVMILFTDLLNTNASELLDGINSVNKKDITITGGVAGNLSKSYVFNEKGVTSSGVAVAALNNYNLNIFTHYSMTCVPVGKSMTVTKSKKDRVYTIDNRTAVDTYKYYFDIDIRKNLLEYAIEFPLIINGDGFLKARTPIKCFDDGSIQFAGNIPEGKKVHLSYGNIDLVIKNSKETIELLMTKSVESIFIYSSIARKKLLGKFINVELGPLNTVSNVSGCFTYGEFFSINNSCKLFNDTMNILAISETTDISTIININNQKRTFRKNRTLHALTHLINTSTKELQQEIEENRTKDKLLAHQSKLASMGEMVENIAHQWRQPLSTLSGSIQNIALAYKNNMLTKEFVEEQNNRAIEVAGYMSNTINDFRNFFSNKSVIEEFFIEDIIEKLIKMLNSTFLSHNIQVVFKNDKNKKTHQCFSDMGSITQVLLNLIFNAKDELINPLNKTKIITISISEDLFYYKIKLRDSGRGIPKKIKDKIFEPHFTTKTTGTGIGLFMSYQIAKERLGGDLVCNNVKEGACFTFSFLKELK